ncbi:MAG: SOS response-associated peptidase, partial [Chloroflexi bacterium]|nr:SOS response-associated peptidase [Chloroflexota bacterium]
VQDGPEPTPRYNIAPTQQVIAVTQRGEDRRLEWMRWGLIPSWAKPDDLPKNTILARSESVLDSGMWKRPLRRTRCLIPADGFFEWTGEKAERRPMFVRMKDGSIFAFAGLYDLWRNPAGELVRSCAIITTPSNEMMAKIHSRMPAILPRGAEDAWLDAGLEDADALLALVKPVPSEAMETWEVTRTVNSAANDSPDCLARAS